MTPNSKSPKQNDPQPSQAGHTASRGGSKLNEQDNLIRHIIPLFTGIGWESERMFFEYPCKVGKKAGKIDLLYKDERDNPLVVVEVKRPGQERGTALEQQAIPYATSVQAPLAVALDGETYLETWHLNAQQPLLDYDGQAIGLATYHHLNEANLFYFKGRRNHSLQQTILTLEEMKGVYKKLNSLGRDMGLTVGTERVLEIAKMVFIKMLCDNNIHLEERDWNYISGKADPINAVNERLHEVRRRGGFNIPDLQVSQGKQKEVGKVVKLLDGVNFNHQNYDITGSLFEEFLSERAQGGTTNDLGQYFTPRNVIELIHDLSCYEAGQEVYDPYCGTGGILLEFFLRNKQNQSQSAGSVGDVDSSGKDTFGQDKLFGSEITSTVSMLAKMNMIIAGDGHSNIVNSDSLSQDNRYVQSDQKFDVVATNMPFDPKVPQDVGFGYFPLAASSSDVAKFIEHCINRCRVGGRVVLIVGKGFLTEKASADFRRNLLQSYCLESVYMLYEGVFHPYTQVFSCLLVINKTKPKKSDTHIDFFSIKDDSDIDVAKQYHAKRNRYQHGFYRVKVSDVLKDENCDLRGRKYKSKSTGLKLGDLVELLPKVECTDTRNKQKLTTPNSTSEGMCLMETKANKQVGEGIGSFKYKIQPGAIVIARITNKRVATGRYLGSALTGDDHGNLLTGEYHQIKPKDEDDLYFILHWLRSREFQEVVELAKGTGGQQRIEAEVILEQPIPQPTDALRKLAKKNLMAIERCNQEIAAKLARIQKIEDAIYHRKVPADDEMPVSDEVPADNETPIGEFIGDYISRRFSTGKRWSGTPRRKYQLAKHQGGSSKNVVYIELLGFNDRPGKKPTSKTA